MNGLGSAGLITMDEASCIASTDAGQLMSRYYLDLETMKLLMKIKGDESLERLLWIVCESHELSDMHLRTDERGTLNALNRNKTTPTIRYPIKGKITTKQMKLSCLIQAVLGCLPIADPSLNQEAMKIIRIADRICKCLVAYITSQEKIASMQHQCYAAVLNSIILAKCIAAHLWENSPFVSKQLKGIGPTFSTLLASAGKVNFMILEESHPRDLERIMNKGPPAGNVLRKQISLLPKYQLTATPIDENTVSIKLLLLNKALLSENMEQLTAGANHKCFVIAGDSTNLILMLRNYTEKDFIGVYDGCMEYKITRKHASEHKIYVHCISSNYAGLDVQCDYTFKTLNSTIQLDSSLVSDYFSNNNRSENKLGRKPDNSTMISRKRRYLNEEIVDSKEKKKRDNVFSQKIQNLKESFGKTSNHLRKDLEKVQKVSNNIICGLTQTDKFKNNIETDINNHDNNIFNPIPVSHEPHNDFQNETTDDFMDDSSINRILNEIETEIIKTKTMKFSDDDLKHEDITNMTNQNATIKARNIPPKSRGFNKKPPLKHLKRTSTYAFLEFLDKNMDLSDEDENVQKESGFSETIKTHIEKYFLNSNKTPDSIDSTLMNLCAKSPMIIKDNNTTVATNPYNQQKSFTKYDLIEVKDNSDINDRIEVPQHESAHKISKENDTKSNDNDVLVQFQDFENTEYLKTLKDNNTQVKKNITFGQSYTTQQHPMDIQQKTLTQYCKSNDEGNLISTTYNIDSILGPENKTVTFKLPNYELMNAVTNEATSPSINRELSFNKVKLLRTNPENKIIPTHVMTTSPSLPEKQELQVVNTTTESQLVPACNMTSSDITTDVKLPNLREYRNNPEISSIASCFASDLFTQMIPPNNLTQGISPTTQPIMVHTNKTPAEDVLPLRSCIKEPRKIEYKRASKNCSLTKPCHTEIDISTTIDDSIPSQSMNTNLNSNIDITPVNNKKTWYSSYESEFINIEKQENDEKYSFSKEKVDIHTKINDDHKIQFVRRFKFDLDIRKIVTKLENKDSAKVQTQDSNVMNRANYESYSSNILQKEHNNTSVKNYKKLEDTTEEKDVHSDVLHKKFKEKDASTYEEVENNNRSKTHKDNNIVDILQKYSKTIGKNKAFSKQTANECITKQNNETKIKPSKTARPFKITDIQRVNLPLPPIYDAIKITPCEETSTLSENPFTTLSTTSKSNIIPIQPIKESQYSEELSNLYGDLTHCHSPTSLLEQSLEITKEDNFRLDQSMFNPKTLLQSVKNYSEEIIPPPPEFDNNTFSSYSPECKDNVNTNMYYFGTSPCSEEKLFAYNSKCGINVNPSTEHETWNENQDNYYETISFPQRTQACYGMTRNSSSAKNNSQTRLYNSFSKRGRLTAFKFNRKTKLLM